MTQEIDRSDLGPLRPKDFSGGDATVARHLESLGFDVERPPRNPTWAEEELILALDLYLRLGLLDDKDASVVDLIPRSQRVDDPRRASGSGPFP